MVSFHVCLAPGMPFSAAEGEKKKKKHTKKKVSKSIVVQLMDCLLKECLKRVK